MTEPKLLARKVRQDGLGFFHYAVDARVGIEDLVDAAEYLFRYRQTSNERLPADYVVDVLCSENMRVRLTDRAAGWVMEKFGLPLTYVKNHLWGAEPVILHAPPVNLGFVDLPDIDDDMLLLIDVTDLHRGGLNEPYFVETPANHAILTGCL